MVACEGQWSDGRVTYPYGKEPVGMLIYDGQGHFSGQISDTGRPEFASGNLLKGSPEELKSAFEGYVAYYGGYEVDEVKGHMTHRVEGSFFPNWVGQEQTRLFEFQGDKLRLSTLPIKGSRANLTVVLLWERAAEGPA